MAAVDPIAYNSLCKLFPALTAKQVTNTCFYSLGANYSETATLQELSPAAVRRSLELTQKNLKALTLPNVKTIFWSRFVLRQIWIKYHLHDVKDAFSFSCLSHIFPKLTNEQIACCVLLSGGHSRDYLMSFMNRSSEIINQLINGSISRLEVGTEFMLKIYVTSCCIIDLS